MNKKEQKLNMILELSSLINSTILFDNNLLKIIKINSIYICTNPYICDNDLILDNNIIFLSYNSKQTNYRHYTNVISNKIIKIKISCFYNYKIINTEELNNIYFIDNDLQNNYYNSYFFKDKNYIIIQNGIFKIIYCMCYGPMSNLSNEYYLKYRIEILNNYFNYIKLDELDIKKMCDELQIKYVNYTDNFYDLFNDLFNEYKMINTSN